jgi:hypothetical protein
VTLVWVLSLLNTSGLGITYDTPGKTNILILSWLIVLMIMKGNFNKNIRTNRRLTFFTLLSFGIIPWLNVGSCEGFSYLMMVPLVYCFSELKVTARAMLLSGYIVAGLGLFILLVYTRTEILSGWNYNHISMIGLFSYIYYSISLYGNMTGRKLTIGLVISLLYISLLNMTDSRSGIIFIILSIVLAYKGDWFRWIPSKRNFVIIALNIPLIISLICILFPNLFIIQYFDEWSMKNFGKSALNGRDTLWMESYKRLFDTYLLGEGEILVNYHNSAVAIISVFGVIGYICWYKLFEKPIKIMRQYIKDDLMFGFLSSFFLIFWQQSFELGFVHSSPNMIPYMILGLGIAHARGMQKRHLQNLRVLNSVKERPSFVEPTYLSDNHIYVKDKYHYTSI